MGLTLKLFTADGEQPDEDKMIVVACSAETLEDGSKIIYCDWDSTELLSALLNQQAILVVVEQGDELPN